MNEDVLASDYGYSMWDGPAEEVTLSRLGTLRSLATSAVEPLWPYLADARTPEEFESRMALSTENMDSALTRVLAESASPDDQPVPLGQFRDVVTATLQDRFSALHSEREASEVAGRLAAAQEAAQARTAALRTAAPGQWGREWYIPEPEGKKTCPGSGRVVEGTEGFIYCPECLQMVHVGEDDDRIQNHKADKTGAKHSPLGQGEEPYWCKRCGGTKNSRALNKVKCDSCGAVMVPKPKPKTSAKEAIEGPAYMPGSEGPKGGNKFNVCPICGTRWTGGLPEHEGICPNIDNHPRSDSIEESEVRSRTSAKEAGRYTEELEEFYQARQNVTYTDGSRVREGDHIRYHQAPGGLMSPPRGADGDWDWRYGVAVWEPVGGSVQAKELLLKDDSDGRLYNLYGHVIERAEDGKTGSQHTAGRPLFIALDAMAAMGNRPPGDDGATYSGAFLEAFYKAAFSKPFPNSYEHSSPHYKAGTKDGKKAGEDWFNTGSVNGVMIEGSKTSAKVEVGYLGEADEEGFVSVFGPMFGVRATVRTTNGGEVTGTISTSGSSYPLDVEEDDGHWVGISGWRVKDIRIEAGSRTAAWPDRSTLEQIRGKDPDGGSREPTDADHKAFQDWVVGTYGWKAWKEYHKDWDTSVTAAADWEQELAQTANSAEHKTNLYAIEYERLKDLPRNMLLDTRWDLTHNKSYLGRGKGYGLYPFEQARLQAIEDLLEAGKGKTSTRTAARDTADPEPSGEGYTVRCPMCRERIYGANKGSVAINVSKHLNTVHHRGQAVAALMERVGVGNPGAMWMGTSPNVGSGWGPPKDGPDDEPEDHDTLDHDNWVFRHPFKNVQRNHNPFQHKPQASVQGSTDPEFQQQDSEEREHYWSGYKRHLTPEQQAKARPVFDKVIDDGGTAVDALKAANEAIHPKEGSLGTESGMFEKAKGWAGRNLADPYHGAPHMPGESPEQAMREQEETPEWKRPHNFGDPAGVRPRQSFRMNDAGDPEPEGAGSEHGPRRPKQQDVQYSADQVFKTNPNNDPRLNRSWGLGMNTPDERAAYTKMHERQMRYRQTHPLAHLLSTATEEDWDEIGLSTDAAFFHHHPEEEGAHQPGAGAGEGITQRHRMERAGEEEQASNADRYWAEHPDEHERHMRQNAGKRENTPDDVGWEKARQPQSATCGICGGTGRVNGNRCSACKGLGRTTWRGGSKYGPDYEAMEAEEQEQIDAQEAARRERQRIHDNFDLYGSPEIPTDEELEAEELARGGARQQAVNESAYGTERYQKQPTPKKPGWTSDWGDEDAQATKEMTDAGMNAYKKPNPLKGLTTTQRERVKRQQVKESARRLAAGAFLDDMGDLDAATGEPAVQPVSTQPVTSKPRQKPSQSSPGITDPAGLTPGMEVAPGQMGGGGGFDGGYAPDPTTDPAYGGYGADAGGTTMTGDPNSAALDATQPTVPQLVAAKVARVTSRVLDDNPGMDPEQARALAARTVEAYPEMVSLR